MKVYSSLFAYLNNNCESKTRLQARDRPVVYFDSPEASSHSLLIPISDHSYEFGFPYLTPLAVSSTKQLQCFLNLAVGEAYNLYITDEVLDLDTIQKEADLELWEEELGERLDDTITQLIRVLVGIFASLFSDTKPQVYVTQISRKLEQFCIEEANLPLVVSLDRRYQLRRKLEAIAAKLRHQLRRKAELMPLGRIQEMDAYCLRDYIRRPGFTAAEKAGAKQELMGIQRYQDYNTGENKFIVYFSQILYSSCYQYHRSGASQYHQELKKFTSAINTFKQQPIVQEIQNRQYQFTKPNYVLQQNPTYRSFYQAYIDFIQKRYEKKRLWQFRNQLLHNAFITYLVAALLRFQGVNVDAKTQLLGKLTPDHGCYLQKESQLTFKVFLQNIVYLFKIKTSVDQPFTCDCLLQVEIHELNTHSLDFKEILLPIWVFWYRPTDEAIAQANIYLERMNQVNLKLGMLVYLQTPPNVSSPIGKIERYSQAMWLCQLPNPIAAQGFSSTIEFIADLIKQAV